MLAMYADGHQASAEDERVHRLLGAMWLATDYDRGKHYYAFITLVSRHAQTATSARTHALALAQGFPTRDQRRQVQGILDELVTSDSHVALQESSFMSLIREVLESV